MLNTEKGYTEKGTLCYTVKGFQLKISQLMHQNIKINYLKHSIAYITSGKKEIKRYIEY